MFIDTFNNLNAAELRYILIRNIKSELPNNLRIGKDIDLLVPYNERSKFINFLIEKGFKNIRHPHCNNIFLYGATNMVLLTRHNMGLVYDLVSRLRPHSLGDFNELNKNNRNNFFSFFLFVN